MAPPPTAESAALAMEAEDTSVTDALRERLDQAKTLKSMKPAEAEAIYESLVAAGGCSQ